MDHESPKAAPIYRLGESGPPLDSGSLGQTGGFSGPAGVARTRPGIRLITDIDMSSKIELYINPDPTLPTLKESPKGSKDRETIIGRPYLSLSTCTCIIR